MQDRHNCKTCGNKGGGYSADAESLNWAQDMECSPHSGILAKVPFMRFPCEDGGRKKVITTPSDGRSAAFSAAGSFH